MGCALIHCAYFLSICQKDRYDSRQKSYPQRGPVGDLFQGGHTSRSFPQPCNASQRRALASGRGADLQGEVKARQFHYVRVFSLCSQFVLTLFSLHILAETRTAVGFARFVLGVPVFLRFSSRGKFCERLMKARKGLGLDSITRPAWAA